ncbi:MAG: pilus assembly protein [Reyranella sp.]|uniref:TadE/TadG family type IV pilus assembly protein n=1 Tax=Reyranella sp. TaxID=1929291 RepID=UPI001AC14D3A|nr:TadE/TadG family type IV pilus assembly protein [Reyranella sp.]MBN9088973.1 pilus assembly protein [Reyranella sp.]
MRVPRSLLRRLAADCRGNLIIEFALALPILMLMLVGLLDLGRFSLQKSAMLQGAREGAQYGITAPTETANINTTAQNASGLTGVTATNTVFCECSSAPGTTVQCTATCSGSAVLKKYITVTTTGSFSSVWGSATVSFGLNGPNGWTGAWTPPTSMTSSVTLIVP